MPSQTNEMFLFEWFPNITCPRQARLIFLHYFPNTRQLLRGNRRDLPFYCITFYTTVMWIKLTCKVVKLGTVYYQKWKTHCPYPQPSCSPHWFILWLGIWPRPRECSSNPTTCNVLGQPFLLSHCSCLIRVLNNSVITPQVGGNPWKQSIGKILIDTKILIV